ncbi:MAG: hypothetical protein JNK63_03050 [Chthonomonas sp.]|nr:hypothetical protein [Chthonomonas sp.]
MIKRNLSPAVGVVALMVVASSAYGQITINVGSATFSSNPGNLTNTGAASGGTNSLHTSGAETAAYSLGADVTVISADLTSVFAGTYAEEPGFKLVNSAFPTLITHFRLATGATFTTVSVPANSIRSLGASGPYTWNSAATLPVQSAIPIGSTWSLEAYDCYDDDVAGPDATGANVVFKMNAYVAPPPPPAWPNPIAGHAVLYDNGNPANAIGQGAGGANASVIATTGTLFGTGVSSAASLSLIDDFTVPAGPGWDVAQISGYGYLTGSSTTSTATGVIVKIWDADPAGLGANVVASSTVMSSTGWSGVFRVQNAASILLTNRPVMNVRASFPNVHLAPGSYYVEYSLTGVSFTPPIMDPGFPTPNTTFAGNARQYDAVAMTFTNVLDGSVNIDVPFTIYRLAPSQNVTGTLALGDTVASFGYTRAISYQLKQGVTTIASGTINANSPSTAFTIDAGAATGSAQLILDGSSFLKRIVAVNLTGSNQAIGTATMQNGDVNNTGEVDAADIDQVIADFSSTSDIPSDADASGEVDAADIDIVIANFGGVDDI